MKFCSLVCLSFLPATAINTQTLKTIQDPEEQNQECLDKGMDMLGCSDLFNAQMDSILNLAYRNLRKILSGQQKADLKTEEIQWLKKRDNYFSEQNKEYQKKFKAGLAGSDTLMAVYQNEPNFVKERAITLIKRLMK